MTQQRNMGNQTNLARSEGLEVTLKSGKKQMMYFDKNEVGKNVESNQKKLLKNLQLNNFVNSLKCGYLDIWESGTFITFFTGAKWDQRFCVLTNVGLLCFANPLQPPTDLFPVVDCKISEVKRNEDGFTQGYYAIKLVYAHKKATFRCLSQSDFKAWFHAITTLQKTAEDKRQELKINEENRLTQIAKSLGV